MIEGYYKPALKASLLNDETKDMRITSDREERKKQKEFLRQHYSDYDPTRHDAFVMRFNREADRQALADYERARGIVPHGKALDLSQYRTGDEQWQAVARELDGRNLSPHHVSRWDKKKQSFNRLLAYTEQGQADEAARFLRSLGIADVGRTIKAGDGRTWYWTVQVSTDTYQPRGASPRNEVGQMFKAALIGFPESSTLKQLLLNPDWLEAPVLWRTRQGIPVYEVKEGLGTILVFDGAHWYEYDGDETVQADVKAMTVAEAVTQALKVSLTTEQQEVLNYIADNAPAGLSDLQEEFGQAVHTIIDQLDRLGLTRWTADEMAVKPTSYGMSQAKSLKGGYERIQVSRVYSDYTQHGRPLENLQIEWRGDDVILVMPRPGNLTYDVTLSNRRVVALERNDLLDVIASA